MPPPASYTISSGLPESFVENSIQDISKNEIEKLEKKERKLLAILKADLVGVMKQIGTLKSDEKDEEGLKEKKKFGTY